MITEYESICAICGNIATETHHLLYGRGIRPLADKDGVTAPLCARCHRVIHGDGIAGTMSKMIGQLYWEKEVISSGKSKEESRRMFAERYGRSWL